MTDPQAQTEKNKLFAIAEISEKISSFLLTGHKESYTAVDAGLLDEGTWDDKWLWLGSRMSPLVEAANRTHTETEPHRIHRVILIPRQPIISKRIIHSPEQINYLHLLTKAVLHFHMWNGTVCYPVFINTVASHKQLIHDADYGAIRDRLTFSMADYYSPRFDGLKLLEGSDIENNKLRAIRALAPHVSSSEKIEPLYYTPSSFSQKRTSEKVWATTRRFLHNLQGETCPRIAINRETCEGAIRNAELDHIVPHTTSPSGSNTLPNLETTCRPCNRSKGKFVTYRRPVDEILNMLPDRIGGEYILKILKGSPPEWCDNYKRPPRAKSLKQLL